MWIKRGISEALRRVAASRPALVLTGARQTGKTSLVRRLFPRHCYVSLDLPATAALAEGEPARFLEQFPPPLIVDEVQYAPGLFRHVKADIDAHRSDPGRFILTGSQKLALLEGVSDSLAGRAGLFELEPLSVREIRAAQPETSLLDLIIRGGFPELYENRDLDSPEFHASYVATYLERDVRSLLSVGSLRDFERFVRACALRSGQLLNKAKLARDVGISPTTANQWLSVLERLNQVVLVEPWFHNRTRSMTKSPKLYLTDTGLLTFLIGVRSEVDLSRSPYEGALWETFVFAELRKRYALAHPGEPIYFWRDRNKEVDFLLHRAGRFEALEAKWTEHPGVRDLSGFHALDRFLRPEDIVSRSIVCRGPHGFPISETSRALSIGDAWFDGDERS